MQTLSHPAVTVSRLFVSHHQQVYRYLLKRCGDPHLADDLTAETFASAFESLRKLATPCSELPWLLGIAAHKLIDHWRRAERDARKVALATDLWLERAEKESVVTFDQESEAVETLANLKPLYRTALQLRYDEGRSVPEIARQLNRTVHSTESLLVRARVALRKLSRGQGAVADNLLRARRKSTTCNDFLSSGRRSGGPKGEICSRNDY